MRARKCAAMPLPSPHIKPRYSDTAHTLLWVSVNNKKEKKELVRLVHPGFQLGLVHLN